jgi:2-hydroxychromene-2-carboxylate isomerase
VSPDSLLTTLRADTDKAITKAVWGVPTFETGGELFWGADGFPMRRHSELPVSAVRSA